MWRPSEVGEVFAERVFSFKRQGRRSQQVRLIIGRPVKGPQKKDPWWCPIRLRAPFNRFVAVAGEDSLQSLVLALQLVQSTLPSLARDRNGTAEWLGEYERLVFAGTDAALMRCEASANLVAGLSSAVEQLEKQDHVRPALLERLRSLVATGGMAARRRR
jgi:hypothetical protein